MICIICEKMCYGRDKQAASAEKFFLSPVTFCMSFASLLVKDFKNKGKKADFMKNRTNISHAAKYALGGLYAVSLIGGLFLPGCAQNMVSATSPDAAGAKQPTVLASAEYPDIPQYPEFSSANINKYKQQYKEWQSAVEKRHSVPDGCREGFAPFFRNSTRTFITDTSDNTVYSPLSLFLALGMTAEITNGNTRQQILDALGQPDIKALRKNAKALWEINYFDDGVSRSVLANSLWASDKITCNPWIMDTIADNYYASAYSGDPESDEYNALFSSWLNSQTDGLLSGHAENIRMDPQMILVLASTINYSGRWSDWFYTGLTEKDVFRSPAGDITTEFLNGSRNVGYYNGKDFTSVILPLENNGEMRLILPAEGISPAGLIAACRKPGEPADPDTIVWEPCECGFEHGHIKEIQADVLEYMLMPSDCEPIQTVWAEISVPKFDISSHTDLIDGLKEMGITDAFDASVSDFSPLSDADDIFIGKASQDSRTLIDENGCRAAAYTTAFAIPDSDGGYESIGKIKFDRPFIFEIMSETDTPLFVGVVNDPV